MTGVPVVTSRKRYLAGLYASERFGSDFFILDDGFQHLELKRDLDLILLDSSHPFGNGRLLPLGPLREPVGQVKRADACILTRAGDAGSGGHKPDFMGKDFPAMRIFRADHLPHSVVFPESGEVHDPEFLKGKRVIAFAGIARPDRFRETLDRVGAEVVYFKGFRDHHPYGPDEITGLQSIREQKGAEYLITTEKDWVRLASIRNAWDRMAYLCVEFSILDGQEEIFAMIRDSAGGE